MTLVGPFQRRIFCGPTHLQECLVSFSQKWLHFSHFIIRFLGVALWLSCPLNGFGCSSFQAVLEWEGVFSGSTLTKACSLPSRDAMQFVAQGAFKHPHEPRSCLVSQFGFFSTSHTVCKSLPLSSPKPEQGIWRTLRVESSWNISALSSCFVNKRS